LSRFQSNTYSELIYVQHWQTHETSCAACSSKWNKCKPPRHSHRRSHSGGGAVKVVAKCDGSIASIKIDPQALNPADAQLLEDMVLTATNQALSQAKAISEAEMGKLTSGLSLPGLG